MPDYDKVVDQISPDDAAALFAQNGMGDHPMAQQIVRKLKGAQTRKRIAQETSGGKPMFASPENDNDSVIGSIKQGLKASISPAVEVANATMNAGGETLKGLASIADSVQAADDKRDAENLPEAQRAYDEATPQRRSLYRNGRPAAAEPQARDLHERVGEAVKETEAPVTSDVARMAGTVAQYTNPFTAPLAVAGSAGNRYQAAKDTGMSEDSATAVAAGDAALNAAIPFGLGKLARAGAGVGNAVAGAAGGLGIHGANSALTATYDPEAAKAQALDPLNIAMSVAPGAVHGAATLATRAGEHVTALKTQAEQRRAAEAEAHQANLDAQAKAQQLQQDVQNAQLVTPQMRSGPDGELVPSKAFVPHTKEQGVTLTPEVTDLTQETRITSPDTTGKSTPPSNGRPADLSAEPEMPPITDINAIYGRPSGKSKPPKTTQQSAPDMLGTAKGEHDVIHGQLREEPEQGLRPVGSETRSDRADVRPNQEGAPRVGETQGARGHQVEEHGLGPVREGQSQEGLTHLSEPARNFVAKQPLVIRQALQESIDHLQQHPDPHGDLGNLQMVVQGLERRINPTRGGAVDIGAAVDAIVKHTGQALKFAGSHIANDSVLVNLERRAGGAARAVQHISEGVARDFKKLNPALQDAVNRYMEGDKTAVIPPEWAKKVDHFRAKQDELSTWAAQQLTHAADHLDKRAATSLLKDKAVKLKEVANTLRDHAATFTSNTGKYINRQYAIHSEGAAWINKVRETPAYNDAIADVMQKNPNMSQEQARAKVEEVMSEQIADALSPIQGGGGVTGAMNERSVISPAFRKLFGEVTDPGERAAISLMKTSQLLENLKVQNGIADAAQHFGLLNEMPQHGAENYVHLSSVGSLKNSPLGGMYAPKSIARQLVGIDGATNVTMRLLAKMSAGTNIAATVGNIASSLPRQAGANVIMAHAHGYLNPTSIADATKTIIRALSDDAYTAHLMSLNVIDQGMTRSQLGSQISHMKQIGTKIQVMDSGLKKGLRTAHQIFSLPDDALRVLSFTTELRRAKARGLQGAEAERWASERMGDSTPDWGKAWALPKKISTYAPGVGQFATMASEITRIQIKSIEHAADAWKSGQYGEAVARTVGLASTMAASYGLAQYIMNKTSGVSSEEDNAMRNSAATPDYAQGQLLHYGDKDETGKRTVTNLSGLDPYYTTSESLRLAADGKPLKALFHVISPYIGASMFGQRLGESVSGSKLNTQGDAQAISKPDAGVGEQVLDRVAHVAGGFEPSTIRKLRTNQPYSVFPKTDFVPDKAARLDVKDVTKNYDAYVKDVYSEAARRGDGTLTDDEAKRIAELQNKRDTELTAKEKQIKQYGGSANATLGAERSNKIRAVDIVHPGDANPEIIKARYRLSVAQKALETFETFKQLSDTDPAKRQFFEDNKDVIRASAKMYERYQAAKRILNIAEVHPEKPELVQRAMSLLK